MSETRMPPFRVTKAAIDQIEALGGTVLIDVEDGGCSGTSYVFSADSSSVDASPNAERYGCEGAWLFVGERATAVMPGATLDYSARLKPPRFRVLKNPNTPDHCPCRRSFGEPWPGPGLPECRSYSPMPWDPDFDPPARWKRQTGYPD